MPKILSLFALALLFAHPALAQTAQPQPKITDCHNAIVIPGTTPISCDVSPSRAEYQGTNGDMQIALSCLWTVQNGQPMADGRFYMTYAHSQRTGTEQVTLRAEDKIVAILVQGNGAIQTEVLTPAGITAKNCANLDIANFTASGCVPAQPAIQAQMVMDTDNSMMQACHNYVAAMGVGGSLTAAYFDPAAAELRMAKARALALELSR